MTLDLFRSLDDEWRRFARTPEANAALAALRSRHTALREVADLDDVVQLIRRHRDFDRRDELLLLVVGEAAAGAAARRIALQAVLPGLAGLARNYRARWGEEDVASMIVTAALERIATYPMRRTARVAANIVRDVQHTLYIRRIRETTLGDALGRRSSLAVAERSIARTDQSPSEELGRLIDEAVAAGIVNACEGQLVYLHRIAGVPTSEIADAKGVRPGTVRKHRRRAELALVDSLDVA